MSTTTTDLPRSLGAEYAAGDEHRPLAGYAALTATFLTALGVGLATARRLPEKPSTYDLILGGVATHKLSRMITKDKVTGFARAPFTRFQEKSGHGEVSEQARGTGLRYALGELMTCPYCIAQWVAGGFVVGYVRAPRVTRQIAALFALHAISDALQLAYTSAAE